MIEDIMKVIEKIEYGFKDENGFNIYKDQKRWDEEFEEFYYLLSPEELLKTECGTCWEQVELERKLFSDRDIDVLTYFICTYAEDASPCHTFLVYEENNSYYWFEHSWNQYKGIHEYKTLNDLLLDVKDKFIKSHEDIVGETFVTKYERPPYHLKCSEMYEYMEHQELLKLNEEEYYYIILNDNLPCTSSDLKGIVNEDDYNDYVVVFKEYVVVNNFKTYKININDEYLRKRMLDIIERDNYKLIIFDDKKLDEFIIEI